MLLAFTFKTPPYIQVIIMELSLPIKFKNIIKNDASLDGELLMVISKFTEWFSANNTEFFPEYTDHGIKHVQSVLNTAEEIISPASWDILSPEDVYVLALSVLLHDCAMHITKSGLWNLITNDIYNGVLLGFSREEEWAKRWKNFTSDVNKFDESDYNRFFSEDKRIELPEVGCSSMDDHQKIIIGDFIRKYHACIAQVIATHGIPTGTGPYELFNKEINYLNELSGLVARSHNHSLRTVVDILDDRKREYRNTHPTYLMGILRIADYLQFKSDRTPKLLFNTSGFCSPISIGEWKKHLAIISTNTSHPDDELLFVEAFPEDAKTLIGIKNLLGGLQKELDEFWAVNGEVYSRYPNLQALAIIFRRVKSNIDNAKQYVDQNYKSYHPEILSIKADDQKLFPLLIKPLYGNLPKIGLREILQNALDACNERFCLEQEIQANYQSIPFQIDIELNFDNNTLAIKDQGIGMDVDVVKNYFLKIGSSYRTSENWKSNFICDDHSLVPRTGKFGIGMLAGFLIGNKIEVHTKRYGAQDYRAINFSYQLDSNEIELTFSEKSEIGTTIVIHSDEENLTDIENGLNKIHRIPHSYDNEKKPHTSLWYYLDSPKVIYHIIKDKVKTKNKPHNSISKTDILNNWNNVEDSTLDGFFWNRNSTMPSIYCNGILIHNMNTPTVNIDFGIYALNISDLQIFIFDNKGIFPLNLTRDNLVTEKFFEIDKLTNNVKKGFTKNLKKLTSNYEFKKKSMLNIIEKYSEDNNSNTNFLPLVFSLENVTPFGEQKKMAPEGYTLVDFITESQKRGLIYEVELDGILNDISYSTHFNVEKNAETIERAIFNYILNLKYTTMIRYYAMPSKPTGLLLDSWLFVKDYDVKKLSSDFLKRINPELMEIKKLNNEWSVLSNPHNMNNIPSLGKVILDENHNKSFIFAIYKGQPKIETELSILWNQTSE